MSFRSQRRSHVRLLFGLMVASLGLGLGLGCSHGPRYRLGSLPFPGPFTLYAAVAGDLGSHRYGDAPRSGPREVSRGTLYTCRAGFVDVAHLRETIDWTRHIHAMIDAALVEGQPTLRFEGLDRAVYELSFHYPPAWDGATDEDHHHAALRVAQRSALLIMTWHEIVTGEGYKTTGVVSERRSAFTYDDMSAHLIGVEIAEQALADPQPYDQAVTEALDARLEQLGIVDRSCLREATRAIEGSWWQGIYPLSRQRETGRETGQLVPRVVEELACCPDAAPEPLPWPPDDLPRIDIDALVSIEMEPNTKIGIELAGSERISEDQVYALVAGPPDAGKVEAARPSRG